MYLDYMGLQLDELLTRYGKVVELWFDSVDMRVQAEYDGQRFLDQVRRLQPETVVNNRLGVPADFITPEQFIPKAIPVKGVRMDSPDHSAADKMAVTVPRAEDFQPWETCMTINDTWAYGREDHKFKTADTLIRSLIEVISRGGNFLLDVGPQPDGLIQPEFVERLQAIGEWTKHNGAAIYGSTYGPVQGQAAYRTTSRGGKIYVFAMDASVANINVGPLDKPIHEVKVLATGKTLTFQTSGKGTLIRLEKGLWEQGIPVLQLS